MPALRPLALHVLFTLCTINVHAQSAQESVRDSNQALYQQALSLLSQGESEKAALLLERLLAIDPLHAGAWLDLAIARCEMGDAQETQRILQWIEKNFRPVQAAQAVIQSLHDSACDAMPREAAPGVASITNNSYRSYIRFGMGYSTNANYGLNSLTIPIGGTGLSLGVGGPSNPDSYVPIPALPLLLSEAYAPRQSPYVQLDLATASVSDLSKRYQLDWQLSTRLRSWREREKRADLRPLADQWVAQAYARARPKLAGEAWWEFSVGAQQWVQQFASAQPSGFAQTSYWRKLSDSGWLAAADFELAAQRLTLRAGEQALSEKVGLSPVASAGLRVVKAQSGPWGRVLAQVQFAWVQDANRGGAGGLRDGLNGGLRASYQWPMASSPNALQSLDVMLSQRLLKDRELYAAVLFPGVKRLNRLSQAGLQWHYQPLSSPWSWRLEWQWLGSEDKLPLFDFHTRTLLLQSQWRW